MVAKDGDDDSVTTKKEPEAVAPPPQSDDPVVAHLDLDDEEDDDGVLDPVPAHEEEEKLENLDDDDDFGEKDLEEPSPFAPERLLLPTWATKKRILMMTMMTNCEQNMIKLGKHPPMQRAKRCHTNWYM